jgi:hypothetical protein
LAAVSRSHLRWQSFPAPHPLSILTTRGSRWRIVDNKLYLNNNPDVGKRWSQDIPGNIAHADDNWPQIKDKTPQELE